MASHTFGILPNGGLAPLVRIVEAVKTPPILWLLSVGSTNVKAGPGLVLGIVLSGGRNNSEFVIPMVLAHAPSLVDAEKRITSVASSWSISYTVVSVAA